MGHKTNSEGKTGMKIIVLSGLENGHLGRREKRKQRGNETEERGLKFIMLIPPTRKYVPVY